MRRGFGTSIFLGLDPIDLTEAMGEEVDLRLGMKDSARESTNHELISGSDRQLNYGKGYSAASKLFGFSQHG